MSDPHAPLRDDVRFLGAVLGDTLREQHGDAFFATVEAQTVWESARNAIARV